MVRSMAPVLGFREIVMGAGFDLDKGLPLSIGRRLALEPGAVGNEAGEDSRSRRVESRFACFLFDSSSADSVLGFMLTVSITSDTISSLLETRDSGSSACIAAETIIGENVHSLLCTNGGGVSLVGKMFSSVGRDVGFRR